MPTTTDRPQAVHYRARIHEVTPNGYRVRLSELAPGRLWGPVASAIPNLAVGDTVVVSQVGISRDNLVILARIPGLSVQVADIPGLRSELDVLAADLATVDARMTVAETDIETAAGQRATLRGDIDANTLRLDGHDGSLTGLDGRVSTLESAPAPVTEVPWGDEYEYGDQLATMLRSQIGASLRIEPGQTVHVRLTVPRAMTITEMRTAISGIGGGQLVQMSLWFGTDTSALPLAYTDAQGTPFGTGMVRVNGNLALAEGDTVVIGIGHTVGSTGDIYVYGASADGRIASGGLHGAVWWFDTYTAAPNPLVVPASGPAEASLMPWLALS